MKNIAKNIVTGIDYEDWLYGLSNFFHKNHLELPANIWLSVRVPGYEPQMWIRRNKRKEFQLEDSFRLTISDSPTVIGTVGDLTEQDLAYFKAFVVRNKPLLLAYWEAKNVGSEALVEGLVF